MLKLWVLQSLVLCSEGCTCSLCDQLCAADQSMYTQRSGVC